MTTTADETKEKVEDLKDGIGKPVGNGKAKRGRKPKQQHLPTMEPPRIPKLEKLADRYCEARDERMALGQKETDARDLLDAAMKEAGLTRYEYGDRVIEVTVTEKIKVRKAGAEGGEAE